MNFILEQYFNFHNNQFDFVKNGDCNKAIFTIGSCFGYFTNRGNNVYFTCLDAVKAFVRLNHHFFIIIYVRNRISCTIC